MSVILGQHDALVALACIEHLARRSPTPPPKLRRAANALRTALEEADDFERPVQVEWLSAKDVSDLLGITTRQVRRLAPLMGGNRIGRDWLIPRAEAESFATHFEKGARIPYGSRKVSL